MALTQRQSNDNLVYWPVHSSKKTQVKGKASTMPSGKSVKNLSLNQDSVRWRHHLSAVAKSRDKSAYQALYIHFAPKIKSFYLQKGLTSKAEELTHEVFIKIWQKAASYNPSKSKVSTWIFTIVRNTRIDYLRKKTIDEINEEDCAESFGEGTLDEELDAIRDKQQISNMFELLNEQQRNVLQKVYFEDKSHQITAEELEMTPGVVKSRIRSALKILRSHMVGKKV
ncbi:MAG: RNA polymerase sigma factor [Kangiellaceae bacterium]